MEASDLDRLAELEQAATGTPWSAGDRWHVAGVLAAGQCAYCQKRGDEPVWVGRRDINGRRMLAHVHEDAEPWWGADSEIHHYGDDGLPGEVASAFGKADVDLIVALRNAAPDLIAAAREREQAVATLREVGRQGQEALAERDHLRATVERVRALHQRIPGDEYAPHRCQACIAGYRIGTGQLVNAAWPCSTVEALDGDR